MEGNQVAALGEHVGTLLERTVRSGKLSMNFWAIGSDGNGKARRFLVTVVALPAEYEELTRIYGEAVADVATDGYLRLDGRVV